jgi:hypothetical protein
VSDHHRPTDVAEPATITAYPIVDLDDNVVWARVKAANVEVWDIWRLTKSFGDGQLRHVGGWE